MPTYTYRCDECNHEFEEFFKTFNPSDEPTDCPSCSSANCLTKLMGTPLFRIKNQPKTFGQQAELNAKRMGKEQMQMMEEAHRKKQPYTGPLPDGAKVHENNIEPETPFWRTGEVEGTEKLDKPLDLDTVKDTTKYILTGDKN